MSNPPQRDVHLHPPPRKPSPGDEQQIRRYMSLARFVGTMRERALWFSRIDKLGDPWEASVSAETFDQVIALARTKARYQNREAGDLANEAEEQIRRFRRRTFVNCWSANEHESHALWRIYRNSTERCHSDFRRSSQRLAELALDSRAAGVLLRTWNEKCLTSIEGTRLRKAPDVRVRARGPRGSHTQRAQW